MGIRCVRERINDRGCLFTELGFRVIGFRVGFSSQEFLGGIFLAGFPINFQRFYTTYFVSSVAHRLEVFSRRRRTRMADQ